MTGICNNENGFTAAYNVNLDDRVVGVSKLNGDDAVYGYQSEQCFQVSNDGEIYDSFASSTFPFQEHGDIITNLECQNSSDFSGVYFIPYSERCLGNRSAHFESRHKCTSYPSAEIPLKMVVGNHHSSQKKLHFSRHLLRKRSRYSPGKMLSIKSVKTKLEKRDLIQEKSLIKSNVLRLKSSATAALSESTSSTSEVDLSTGDRRQIANARERQRVSHLNDGFDKLRRVLPWMRRSRRVSKVDTLRGAIAYIKYLQQQVWARDLTAGCMDCLETYCLPRSAIDQSMTSSFATCYIKTP